MSEALFKIIRDIKRKGLTQDEVDRINAALPAQAPVEKSIDPNDLLLLKELERDEGRVLHAYQDNLGFWTIGIGRLIDKRKGGGIANEEADYLKLNDIAKVKAGLDRRLAWWRTLDAVRQRVVMNLAFNLGADGLADKWPNTVALIRMGAYAEAAKAMRNNRVWNGQVKGRAERLAKMMETGSAA